VTVYAETSSPIKRRMRSWLVALTSLAFILLQSACTAVMAISGIRLLIGVGSLAAVGVPGILKVLHLNVIRVPMMTIAVLGCAINLYVIWRIRVLRARPSAQWRVQPVTARQRRSETLQIVLSVVTLLLVFSESAAHHILHHGGF
jgi:hypothetical protein